MSIRYWLALQRVPGLGTSKAVALFEELQDITQLFCMPRSDLLSLGLAENSLDAILKPSWKEIEADLRWVESPGCSVISFEDAAYPALLRQIAAPPTVLFLQGNNHLLQQPQLAIVGSRNPTASGLELAQQFAKYLAQAGLVITSGLALGIDGASHRGALAAKGKTIAVLGSGLNNIYPAAHQKLSEEIMAQQGLLLSEFTPATKVRPEHFPRRNRIISGLSMGVLVVEAALKSGSLITARLAMEQGREVFAIPGSINNPVAKGCHALLKQGAKLVEMAQDILEELGPLYSVASQNLAKCSPSATPLAKPSAGPLAAPDLDQDYSDLLQCIAYEPTPVDLMVVRSGLSAKVISSMLLILELKGMVESLPGGYIRK